MLRSQDLGWIPTVLPIIIAMILGVTWLWLGLQISADVAFVLTPIVISGGFWFAYKAWEAQRKARVAQVLLSLCARWDSQEMAEARYLIRQQQASFQEDMLSWDKDVDIRFFQAGRVANFFEDLGVAVLEGYVEARVAYELFWGVEENYYRVFEPIIQGTTYRQHFSYWRLCMSNSQKKKSGEPKLSLAPPPK